MVVRLINFADRSVRHLSLEENDLIFSTMLNVVLNEDSSSLESFNQTFAFPLIQEHKFRSLNILISRIPTISPRNSYQFLSFLFSFMNTSECPYPTTIYPAVEDLIKKAIEHQSVALKDCEMLRDFLPLDINNKMKNEIQDQGAQLGYLKP